MALAAFPAFFTGLLAVYFLGPASSAGSRSSTRTTAALVPGFNWTFLSSAFRHAQLPVLVIVVAFAGGWVLNMRTVMINTIGEDYVAMAHAKGLRDRRVMTRYAGRNAILPPLNGFAAQFATAVGGLVFIEFVFSYPGAGLTLQQAALGNDYPLTQALLLVFALCVIVANFIMDIAQPRPRPAGADRLAMSQLQPALELAPVRRPSSRTSRARRIPGWLDAAAPQPEVARRARRARLHGRRRADRAAHLRSRPDGRSTCSTRARRRRGTTCSGRPTRAATSSRRSCSARGSSLLLGAAAGALATVLATTLGILAAYAGGIVDDAINFLTNVFLVIPTIPLLIVISAYLKSRSMGTMILVLALTLWAFEARILRGQALSLRNRDFVLAAKVAGESTWRIVFGELMPNMISRIAAGFVLVFYIALLVDAGLEFLGLGDTTHVSWGMTLYWAQTNSTVLQGEWWPFVFPGLALALTVLGADAHPGGHRRGAQPAAPATKCASGGTCFAASCFRAGGRHDVGAAGRRPTCRRRARRPWSSSRTSSSTT